MILQEFNLEDDDYIAINIIQSALKKLLEVDCGLDEQVSSLQFALDVVERLPQSTPGAWINVDLSIEGGYESRYSGFLITDSEIELSSGGSVYDLGIGSDSYSDPGWRFDIEGGGEREADLWALEANIVEMLNLGAEVLIENDSASGETADAEERKAATQWWAARDVRLRQEAEERLKELSIPPRVSSPTRWLIAAICALTIALIMNGMGAQHVVPTTIVMLIISALGSLLYQKCEFLNVEDPKTIIPAIIFLCSLSGGVMLFGITHSLARWYGLDWFAYMLFATTIIPAGFDMKESNRQVEADQIRQSLAE
jgi:hypothetical protein